MARRKPARRAARQTKVIDWRPDIAGLFRLAAMGWTPPASVRVSAGARSQTWTAVFQNPNNGQAFQLKVRLRLGETGWHVADETLETRLIGRVGGAK
jgi:hypothetical protein